MKKILLCLALLAAVGCESADFSNLEAPEDPVIFAEHGSDPDADLEALANEVQGTTRYYFYNNLAPGSAYHGELRSGTWPTPGVTATGWTVGNEDPGPAGQWSLQDFQTERPESSFEPTDYASGWPIWHPAWTPPGAPNLGHCWRTPALTAGTTAVEWWYLFAEVQAVSSGGSQDGLVDPGLSLVRGSDPDGVNPVLGILEFPTSEAINLKNTSPWQVLTKQFYPGQLAIQDGDYLYLCLSWKITGAGTSNSKDVRIRVGGNTWLQVAAIQ